MFQVQFAQRKIAASLEQAYEIHVQQFTAQAEQVEVRRRCKQRASEVLYVESSLYTSSWCTIIDEFEPEHPPHDDEIR